MEWPFIAFVLCVVLCVIHHSAPSFSLFLLHSFTLILVFLSLDFVIALFLMQTDIDNMSVAP